MKDITIADTLAHEQLARDEQSVGVFFAAFAVQYLLHKDMLQNKMTKPNFIKLFGDFSLTASQRIFIKEIIGKKEFQKVVEEMQNLLLEALSLNPKQALPHLLYLSRIPKSFLIRQVFKHSDQILPKYDFIDKLIVKDIRELDFSALKNNMWTLPSEQQLLVLVKLFIELGDDKMDKKRKTVIDSFTENLARWKIEMKKHTDNDGILNSANITTLTLFVDNYYATEELI